eukprot:TRINITY_DN92_c0_g1_i1.p1 TRINITY_DN92_c0_g1~~TRINITY_DN92_c0_g1_i1.p1  ORF type:complete len:263 (-),score=38.26 TRINITY_DN92_c0_g1_i1:482-1270(-)
MSTEKKFPVPETPFCKEGKGVYCFLHCQFELDPIGPECLEHWDRTSPAPKPKIDEKKGTLSPSMPVADASTSSWPWTAVSSLKQWFVNVDPLPVVKSNSEISRPIHIAESTASIKPASQTGTQNSASVSRITHSFSSSSYSASTFTSISSSTSTILVSSTNQEEETAGSVIVASKKRLPSLRIHVTPPETTNTIKTTTLTTVKSVQSLSLCEKQPLSAVSSGHFEMSNIPTPLAQSPPVASNRLSAAVYPTKENELDDVYQF